MKKIMILLLISCTCFKTHAQLNFVLNGSFEDHIFCPFQPDQIKFANYWNSIDTSWSPGDTVIPATFPECLPEYISICGTGLCAAPSNGNFFQYPRTGSGMVQSEIYYNFGFTGLDQYNYLQGRLKNHLVSGQSYCVTFHVNMEPRSSYAVNKIGAYLDDGSIDTTSRCAIPQTQYTPQILDTNVISDTLNWVRIQGSFIANGTELFITIGDFFDTANVTKITTGVGLYTGLYLIDDVSVIASDAVAYAGADTTIKPGDTAHIGAVTNGDGMPCWWYVAGNATPIDSGGTIKVHPTTNTTYVVKMDLCGSITYDTVKVWVWPALVGSLQSAVASVRVYPNPASSEVTIEVGSAKGLAMTNNCEVVFYDVVGRPAFAKAMAGDPAFAKAMAGEKEVIDVSGLVKGVYFVKITDPVTGESITKRLLKE